MPLSPRLRYQNVADGHPEEDPTIKALADPQKPENRNFSSSTFGDFSGSSALLVETLREEASLGSFVSQSLTFTMKLWAE